MVDFMKKTELMKEFQELEEEKQVHIDGITKCRRKAPCFSNGDIRRLLLLN